ncbi:MAG: hypothetical protein E7482_04085 [Ruminococcaceae bacterium]|nr:hypothetical protein [Oscillospiraceae bacterium]
MKNIKRDNAIARFLYIIVGAVCGIFMIFASDPEKLFGKSPRDFVLQMAFCMIMVFVAFFIQAVIHEFGHLLFGLLTGYKFISFRIGNVMFIKESGKLRIKLYSIVGTGGQCLMMPPPWKENLPTVLYNFGGCILNFITSAVFLIIFIFMEKGTFWAVFVGMLSAVGFGNVLLNGIPLQVGGISNDGRNAFLLGKNPVALRSFWLQLYVNGLISEGERMRNMPGDWFFLPSGEDLFDPMVCTVGVMKYNYFYDIHDFKSAELTAEYMLRAPGLLGLHRNELSCELLFLKIFRGAEPSEIEALYTKELDKYIKATANYVSRRRLAYAYQLLYLKNITMAQKCLEVFEKTVKSYPYSAEIENEKEIIELIKAKAEIY